PHKRRTRSYHGRHRHRILSLARHGQVGVMTPVASPRRNLHACWSLAQEVTCAPNHRSLHVRRLLRARRERPRRRAAEQHDELAAFQLIGLHLIPHEPGPRTAAYRTGKDQSAAVVEGRNEPIARPRTRWKLERAGGAGARRPRGRRVYCHCPVSFSTRAPWRSMIRAAGGRKLSVSTSCFLLVSQTDEALPQGVCSKDHLE